MRSEIIIENKLWKNQLWAQTILKQSSIQVLLELILIKEPQNPKSQA